MQITSCKQKKHLDNALDDQADDQDKPLANFFKLLFTELLTTRAVASATSRLAGHIRATRGCTIYYVWEPRAFMIPPKNPMVYERLYV